MDGMPFGIFCFGIRIYVSYYKYRKGKTDLKINTKRITALFAATVFAFAPSLSLRAAEQGSGAGESAAASGEDLPTGTFPVEIYTYEDLLQVAENPAGSYRLMENINMEGLSWEPVDFSGVFDGNGYALLNLEVNSIGAGVEDTYDGNHKVYDTYFAGFFSTLKGAEVSNLNLVNVKVLVETDKPCFIGSIAGYSVDSVVRDCNIQGRLELSAYNRMFGVGGIIGYGSGLIERTNADVTLICTDTDASTRDEQFLGGAYAAGYIDLNECNVVIDGYDSDHGYVHNGGLVGMYILYPKGLKYYGYITNNTIKGKITFFEDNTDRRAYCKEYIGETMNRTFTNKGNQADFKRDERYEYSVDLRPDMCVDAVHTETVTEPGCDTFGYTTVKCEGCGYAYTDHYTLYRHFVEEWVVTEEPTVQNTGIRTGTCAQCGMIMMEVVEKLEPPAETPAPQVTDAPEETVSSDKPSGVKGEGNERDVMDIFKNPVVICVIVVLVLALVLGEIIVFKDRKRR